MTTPAASRQILVASETGARAPWGIAEETAVEIGFNGRPWTVMMATPQDVEDLCVGLAYTSGAVCDAVHVKHCEIKTYPEGITADLTIDPAHFDKAALGRRTLDGVTGCGLCGVETLADAVRPRAMRREARTPLPARAIEAGFAALPDRQPLNKITRTVHAAAWCNPDGRIDLVREDIGRHNALDKLIGARVRERHAEEPGFIVMSSRCSFELVAKAARTNARLLATVSAPTGYALDLAREVRLPLASRGPEDEIVFFPHKEGAGVENAG